MASKARSQRALLSSDLVSGLRALGEASRHVVRTLKQPRGEVRVERNPLASPSLATIEWATMEASPPAPGKLQITSVSTLISCSLMRDPQLRITHQVPDPEKAREITHNYRFQSLSLGGDLLGSN